MDSLEFRLLCLKRNFLMERYERCSNLVADPLTLFFGKEFAYKRLAATGSKRYFSLGHAGRSEVLYEVFPVHARTLSLRR